MNKKFSLKDGLKLAQEQMDKEREEGLCEIRRSIVISPTMLRQLLRAKEREVVEEIVNTIAYGCNNEEVASYIRDVYLKEDKLTKDEG